MDVDVVGEDARRERCDAVVVHADACDEREQWCYEVASEQREI